MKSTKTKRKSLRILSVFLAVLTVLTLGSVFSFGDTEKPVTVLWEDESNAEGKTYDDLINARNAYWDEYYTVDQILHYSYYGEGFEGWIYMNPINCCLPLLYTEQAKEWTPLPDVDSDDRTIPLYFAEVDAAVRNGYSDPKNNSIPIFLCALRQLGISKEELYAAREKMLLDPESGSFPSENLKEEVISLVRNSDRYSWYPEDFMIEALYMENKRESLNLLILPYSVYTPQGMLDPYILETYYTDFQGGLLDFTKIRQFDVEKEDFERMESYVRAYCAQFDGADAVERSARGADKWMKIIDEAKAIFFPAPQTGEHTVLYVFAAVSALSALAALCVGRRKRRI